MGARAVISRSMELHGKSCAVFIPDDKRRALYAGIHAWAPAGSFLGFDFDGREPANYPAALAMLGDGFFMPTPDEFAPLLGPSHHALRDRSAIHHSSALGERSRAKV